MRERSALDKLKTLHAQLRVVHAGIVVAAVALRQQRAEQDEEIARVLQFLVGDRLSEQIDELADVVEKWGSRGSVRECVVHTSWSLAREFRYALQQREQLDLRMDFAFVERPLEMTADRLGR